MRGVVLDTIVGVIALVTVGSYIWSVRYHFKAEQLRSGAKLISMIVIMSAGLLMFLTWWIVQPVSASIAGIAVLLASNILFWSAIRHTSSVKLLPAFTEANPHAIVVSGPYRYVRHPFYTSYIMFWTGWAVATWSVWSLVPLVGLTVMYWHAASDEEAKFHRTDMAGKYAEYSVRTGRFFPRLFAKRA